MATDHMPKVPSPNNLCPAVNMSQSCKVCGEPAAGFHFGAFTCEGCKSFFGRTYNNLSSLNECKSSGRCVINKKTRTSCKSCRLRKCLTVGMSKSGSRYGRRSNWFKIHYLMQSNNNSTSTPDGNSQSDETITRIPISPSVPTTTIGDAWDAESSPLPASLRVPTSEGLKFLERHSIGANHGTNLSLKRDQDQKVTERIRLGNIELPYNIEVKELSSPNSSSAGSPSSESPKDPPGDPLLFPGGNEAFYPKDILSLYNIPSLGAGIPPYLASPVMQAQRFLYPYYPNILSLYTRHGYLDSFIKDAVSSSEPTELPKPTPSLSDEEDSSDTHNEYQPPQKIIKSSSSPPSRCLIEPHQSPWLKREAVSAAPPSPPPVSSTCPPLLKEPQLLTEKLLKRKVISPDVAKSPQQEAPIDLSIRGRTETEEKRDNVSPECSPPNGLSLTVEGKTCLSPQSLEASITLKEDQKNPLDLSGFKT